MEKGFRDVRILLILTLFTVALPGCMERSKERRDLSEKAGRTYTIVDEDPDMSKKYVQGVQNDALERRRLEDLLKAKEFILQRDIQKNEEMVKNIERKRRRQDRKEAIRDLFH